MAPTDPDPQHCCKQLGLYLFQKGQKAGEDGEEDEKEADISQSRVGLEHGNQSFFRVLMKKCAKQFDGTTARIKKQLCEKKAKTTLSTH